MLQPPPTSAIVDAQMRMTGTTGPHCPILSYTCRSPGHSHFPPFQPHRTNFVRHTPAVARGTPPHHHRFAQVHRHTPRGKPNRGHTTPPPGIRASRTMHCHVLPTFTRGLHSHQAVPHYTIRPCIRQGHRLTRTILDPGVCERMCNPLSTNAPPSHACMPTYTHPWLVPRTVLSVSPALQRRATAPPMPLDATLSATGCPPARPPT